MRLSLGLSCALVVCAAILSGQTPEDPQLRAARERVEKLKSLVDVGAASRAQLEQAQDEIADAEDAAILRRTVYGQDLTDAQSEEMQAAADRRFERRKKAYDKAQKLVELGVATQASLGTFLEEMDLARKECELAADRAKLVHDLTVMAQAEQALEQRLATAPATSGEVGERFDGDGTFNARTFARVESAFEAQFGKPLPVSAMGETAVHRAMGFDHTGRVDVAIHPDQPEGVWLRAYLSTNHIPYFAFRQAVPGKATGAHIHLGPQSTRLAHGG